MKNKKDSWYKKVAVKMYNVFGFGFYIRVFMLTYMTMMFAAFPEIYSWAKNEKGNFASRIFSTTVVMLCVGSLIVAGVYWIFYANKVSEKQENEIEENPKKKAKLAGCFAGMKSSRYARLHTFLFFLKRFLICVLLFFLKGLDVDSKLYMFIGIQVIFYAFILILRSPKLMKDQINEIINESVYLLLISMMFLNENNIDWGSFGQNLFIYLIMFNFILQFLVTLGKYSLLI